MTETILDKLSKYHIEWLKMVRSLGGDAYSEDVVQDMYLKVYNNNNILNHKGQVNKYYVYLALKSVLLDYFRKRSKQNNVNIDDHSYIKESNDVEREEAYHKLTLKIDEQVNNWHWYDKDLFELYRHSGLSIRKIADETTISWVSIFHTLKDCKGKIKEELAEDYKKFKEENYE